MCCKIYSTNPITINLVDPLIVNDLFFCSKWIVVVNHDFPNKFIRNDIDIIY